MEKTILENVMMVIAVIVAFIMLLVFVDGIIFIKNFKPFKWLKQHAKSNSNASKESQPKPNFKSSGYRAQRKASK